MLRLLSFLRWLTAAALLLVLVLLAWHCIDMYIGGLIDSSRLTSSSNQHSPFSLEAVTQRLNSIMPALLGCALVSIVTSILHAFVPVKAHSFVPTADKYNLNSTTQKGSHVSSIRTALLIVAVLFIVLGVMNGGLRDVLVKAINICTECIGLG